MCEINDNIPAYNTICLNIFSSFFRALKDWSHWWCFDPNLQNFDHPPHKRDKIFQIKFWLQKSTPKAFITLSFYWLKNYNKNKLYSLMFNWHIFICESKQNLALVDTRFSTTAFKKTHNRMNEFLLILVKHFQIKKELRDKLTIY